MIIGLSGTNAAGKQVFCDYMKTKGFESYSLSDVLREELRAQRKELTRDNLREYGNELRRKEGPFVLAKRIKNFLKKGKNYVIDSIRLPGEVEELRKVKGFSLVFIDAPIEDRFKRAMKRNREKDAISLEEFKKAEEKELTSKDLFGQNLLGCKDMAFYVIENDGSIDDYHRKIDILFNMLKE